MAKKRTRTWYIKQLALRAKKYVKDRDSYTCQYSGKVVSGCNCHASHVLNVGTHKYAELDPFNLKVLSSYYHLHWWHKDPLHSSKWFASKFPERYEYLMSLAEHKVKIPTEALEYLYKNTKADGSNYANEYYSLLDEVMYG